MGISEREKHSALSFLLPAVLFFMVLIIQQPDENEYSKKFPEELKVSEGDYQYTFQILQKDSALFSVFGKRTSQTDTMIIHPREMTFTIFKALSRDINNDSVPEILLGVIKKSKFDPVMRKRLFIYTLRNDRIIPLWLSSRLVHPMDDFAVTGSMENAKVRTIELEQNGSYLVSEYVYSGFGLSWERYLGRTLSKKRATQISKE